MAVFNCTCGTGGIGNLGLPSCNTLLDVVSRVIIVPTYDNDGNRNAIKATDLVNGKIPDGYFNDKLTEADPSKRWYITDKLFDEVEISNTDRTTQTTSSGAMYELLQGVVTFTGKLYKRPAAYKGQLNSAKCGENGVYFVDVNGSLMGEVSTDGSELFPAELQEGSVVAEWFPKSDTSESYVSFDFQLDRIVKSENFLTVDSGNIEENLKKAESLIDVTLSETDGAVQTATDIFITAEYALYGSFGNLGSLEGKTNIADWTITDPSAADTLVVTGVTETSGDYVITYTGGTATSGYAVNYVENRTTAKAKGFESNELLIIIP